MKEIRVITGIIIMFSIIAGMFAGGIYLLTYQPAETWTQSDKTAASTFAEHLSDSIGNTIIETADRPAGINPDGTAEATITITVTEPVKSLTKTLTKRLTKAGFNGTECNDDTENVTTCTGDFGTATIINDTITIVAPRDAVITAGDTITAAQQTEEAETATEAEEPSE